MQIETVVHCLLSREQLQKDNVKAINIRLFSEAGIFLGQCNQWCPVQTLGHEFWLLVNTLPSTNVGAWGGCSHGGDKQVPEKLQRLSYAEFFSQILLSSVASMVLITLLIQWEGWLISGGRMLKNSIQIDGLKMELFNLKARLNSRPSR